MRGLKRKIAIGLILFVTSNAMAGEFVYSWELPFLPIKISYSKSQGCWLSAEGKVKTTLLGTFSIGYTQDILSERLVSSKIHVGSFDVSKQDLLVVIRDRNKRQGQDEVYYIKNGYFLDIKSKGETNIQVRDGLVVVDVTNVDRFYAELNPRGSQGIKEIAYRLSQYYKNLALNRHEEVGKMYAIRVDRYYNLVETTRQKVVEQIKNYDNIFNVYGKTFDIKWNSLEVEETSNKYIVTYMINYTIDRRDKTLPTYFEIRMFLEMNKQYEITSIYEKILRRK